ncbi:serine/threonine protein kinase [Luteolibacter flavescens]|uniref:Serine/threonine protein kinase n=1 Tax=Luteolibacter flavescens TaxID=1859460 RepID=A0ABT3FL27_9BACT|nr:serine/threonine-protein kinase [Luteolibacter flavescens]MCW1884039.1 serine/threonine protein kinase [Luteolibacter flavescens]
MSATSFEAPTLEVLSGLLPAYEFDSFIAQGGMGAVYKARQKALDRDVAVKVLPRELGEDPAFRHSFETEAKAMARLNHPNLIGVYDSGDIDGMLYIVMEYVNGKSLYHSAYNMRVDPEQAAALVKGICDGLAHAHENGVIHRDIKPANILLNEKIVPKIGDFGLARPADAESAGLTMGTPGYTAPEIYDNPEHFDVRTDIYAVGVILYELLTGHKPEEEDMRLPSSVINCDKKLDAIWQKSTDRDPSRRYASAEEMGNDLEGWANREPEAVALRVAQPQQQQRAVPQPHVPQAQALPQVRSAHAAAPRRPSNNSMVMHQKKTDMTVPIILTAVVLVGGGLVGFQMHRATENKRDIAAKEEAARIEKAKVEAHNEAVRKAQEKENAPPDPSTIRFAPEPTQGKPPETPPATPPAGTPPP